MIKCPYCGKEMKNGFVEGDGRQSLIWVEEGQKRNFLQNMSDENCIVLAKSNLFHKTRVASHYCEQCQKIIVDI